MFNYSYNLIKTKWLQKSDESITTFINFFDKDWIQSGLYGWYEGYARGSPSTTNASEVTNNIIKNENTFLERLSLSRFLAIC